MLLSVALACATLTGAPLDAAALPSLTNPATPRAASAQPAEATPWRIDVSHSELTFSVRHLVSRVRGSFGQWTGKITADPENWSTASVEVTIQTASITTNNERRDNHLRSSDFFLADSFPTITFKSTKVERSGDDIKVHGNLTLRGVTKPVVLEGSLITMRKGENGKYRAGFDAKTKINRMDYGVSWNRAAEGGGMTLSDEVTIEISLAAIQE